MPKMKTHRGAAKRFRRTAKGKIVRSKQGRRHILTKKTTKRKRQMRKRLVLNPTNEKRFKQLLPE